MIRFTIQASRACLPRMRGFTLAELMIVISIAAVLAAIAVPSFKPLIRSITVRGAATELIADIQFARSEAIRAGRAISFTLDKARRWRVFLDKDRDGAYDAAKGDELLRENTYTETILPMTEDWLLRFQPSGLTENMTFPGGICLQTGNDPLVQRYVRFSTRAASPIILEECPQT